ncbi:hypothetical protein DL764_005028 [Monosporascus ibericus]|uniref:Uncharacterized protein n=1 Tax=Monosporascus ibericus TaxID=155417 RepID=A0A4V1XAR3_9PEZI|nr:hypothetical protein DL764_005028 [Monosporascus ibericus]
MPKEKPKKGQTGATKMSQASSTGGDPEVTGSNENEGNHGLGDGRFRWDTGLLVAAPDSVDKQSTNEEVTAYWLERIRNSTFAKALDIVEEREVVLRLLEPFEYRVGNKWTAATFNIGRDHQAQALAAYILLPSKNKEPCVQCSSHKSRGPCLDCLSFGNDWFGRACSNCKYSGTPQNCSFFKERVAEEEKQKRADRFEEMRNNPDKIWFTQDDLKDHLASELEELADIIQSELNERASRRAMPGKSPAKTPAKRQRQA